jgi:hypothetical protein
MTNTNDQTEVEMPIHRHVEQQPQPEPSVDLPEAEFRDFQIEAPKPPWRLKLEPPLDYDGEKFSELIFDYDALIAKDFVRAERTFLRIYKPDKNESAVLPEMHHDYHIVLAAQTANVPIGVIYKLPRRYYIPVRLEALKACGSSPEEEKA